MYFGVLFSMQVPPGSGLTHSQLYREMLEQTVLAEELGFDSAFLAEHHFLEDGICPSLLTTAASIAAKTTRIKVGTSCLLLPLYNPIKIAEDAAIVDLISNGRLILGVATGYRPEEFEGFGINIEDRGQIMDEQIQILQGAWSEEPLSFEGKFFNYRQLPVTPKPVQRPPPIWMGTSGKPGLRRAAKLGLPLVASPRHHINELKSHYTTYRQFLNKYGQKISDVPVIRYVFVHESQDRAEQIARDPIVYVEKDMYGAWTKWRELKDDEGRSIGEKDEVTYESHRQRFLFGKPSYCTNQIERHKQELGMNHLICWMQLPGLPHKYAIESMKLFAKEIMPSFQ